MTHIEFARHISYLIELSANWAACCYDYNQSCEMQPEAIQRFLNAARNRLNFIEQDLNQKT